MNLLKVAKIWKKKKIWKIFRHRNQILKHPQRIPPQKNPNESFILKKLGRLK